jgi:DNA invertase Pin-like site-specific DNA recombinase
MRAAAHARVSTHEQQSLGLQVEAMAASIQDRGWDRARRVEDIGSGAKERSGRTAPRRRRAARAMRSWSAVRTARGDPRPTGS